MPWSASTPNTDTVRQGLLGGLAASERAAGEAAQCLTTEFRSLLLNVLEKLTGELIQAERNHDPHAFTSWTPARWREFLAHPGVVAALRKANVPDRPQEAAAQAEIERLSDEIAGWRVKYEQSQAALKQAKHALGEKDDYARKLEADLRRRQQSDRRLEGNNDLPEPRPATVSPQAGVYAEILARIGPNWREPLPPPAFREQVSGAESRWRRQSMALFVVGQYGFNARVEVEHLVGVASGLNSRSTSLREAIDHLTGSGVLLAKSLRMTCGEKSSTLGLLELSTNGKELCRSLGWEPVESERERLARLAGSRSEMNDYTFAVLAFALHARMRGWRAEVLPVVSKLARPDVCVVQGDEAWYVSILPDEKSDAWRSLAALQGNKAAICTTTLALRKRLVAECRQAGIGGAATDLETLVPTPLKKLSPDCPLWSETWECPVPR